MSLDWPPSIPQPDMSVFNHEETNGNDRHAGVLEIEQQRLHLKGKV